MAKRQPPAESLIEISVEPKRKVDQDKLIATLEAVAARDSSFKFSVDASTGLIVAGGVSEMHLDTIVDSLQRSLGFDINIGSPQVAYRETISRPVDVDYTHAKQFGGGGEFARVHLSFEPGAPGSNFVFVNTADDAVPNQFLPGVIKAFDAARRNGVVAGFPLIDFKATLIDGAYHDVDSSALTFESATRTVIQMLKGKRAVALLEPVMVVEVVTPDEFVGGVIGDLRARRGAVQDTGERGSDQVVTALVPLANMFGYANSLLAMTKGRGSFTLAFDHYQPASPGIDDDPDKFPPAAAKARVKTN